MHTVNAREARRRLSDLLSAAEHGGTISITRRGREVARLTPPEEPGVSRLPDLSEFRAAIKVKGKPLSETILDMRNEERLG